MGVGKDCSEAEARDKANHAANGGDKVSEGVACTIRDTPIAAKVDTRQELADSVGLGRNTMSKVMQIDDNAPEAIRQALDKKELSVNWGYELTKRLEDVPEAEWEQAAAERLEYERAKKLLAKKNAEIDRKSKIAKQFSKVFEKAILLEVNEENVRIWTDCPATGLPLVVAVCEIMRFLTRPRRRRKYLWRLLKLPG